MARIQEALHKLRFQVSEDAGSHTLEFPDLWEQYI